MATIIDADPFLSEPPSHTEIKLTPMMAQWQNCKQQVPGSLLLFRMGDFYEAFYEDAAMIAKELELTLTQRQGIPMSGVPHHACDNYIDRLVAKGYRVAIAEQMEDPKQAKGIVKRDIVRIVTPGTVINSTLLSEKSNNFFASLIELNSVYGLSYVDMTTGEFYVIEFDTERDLLSELYRLHPSEVLTSDKFYQKHTRLFEEMRLSYGFALNKQEHWKFDHQTCYHFLTSHFHIHNLDGFGLTGLIPGINAAGALLNYLQEDLRLSIVHINRLQTYTTAQYLSLDRISQRNLELTESLKDGSKKNTLLEILDYTKTPMGGRLLRNWLKQPLLSVEKIHYRQNCVEALVQDPLLLQHLQSSLDRIRDLERLTMKVSAQYATPRDLVTLAFSLEQIPAIKSYLSQQESLHLVHLADELEEFDKLANLIRTALIEEPALKLGEGNVFREGYHPELDELMNLKKHGKDWMVQYQSRIREETGIKTLKIGFNRVFGYYIEVSAGQADRVPASFIRRQTLANNERFVSPELKEYEEKVLHAEEKIVALEQKLFQELRNTITTYSKPVLETARVISQIDCLQSLAHIAREKGYVKPLVDGSTVLEIEQGRHPVVETVNPTISFVPNDTTLDDYQNRLLLITGPNMAGKSTYIRQVALIAIMAQMGSFVPAAKAHIGIIDKIFTRIGASDDLSRGQSTFMVEMTETANILNNATSRSLVILDEIGRGTSTYDGISIAWSVAEFLLTTPKQMAKTLFATHYWELTQLEEMIPGAVNYHVAVKETDEDIVFLHQIVKGKTNRSYGIQVAKLAGLPIGVVARAKEILLHLEENNNKENTAFAMTHRKFKRTQLTPKEVHPVSGHEQLSLF
ncbi:MAG: mutS [Chlamydiales bacterium]|jgi:DNA mismatch repair protein MutS|nr:mutS [Chlamydiales bacterium]